ncbi:MAG: hypothetical protein ACYDH4_02220 [Candidatus Cryosericum sp.]
MKLFYIIEERAWLSKRPRIMSGMELHLSGSGFAVTLPVKIRAAPGIISGMRDS